MVSIVSKVAIAAVGIFAVLYQFLLSDLIFRTLGHGRKVRPVIELSNVRCERIEAPGLEGCEDMWLHEPTGHLYLACSDVEARTKWFPAIGHLEAAKRSLTDRIAMLDTRAKGPVASRLTWLDVKDFPGNRDDGTFNLLGMTMLPDKHTNMLRILLVNDRPSIHPATEHFLTKAGTSTMQYVRTHVHPLIKSPNSLEWVSDHSFLFTNYKNSKVGILGQYGSIFGGGSIVYCDRTRCNEAYKGLKIANGITRTHDGLVYVAETITGKIHVFTLTEAKKLHKVDEIDVGIPLDNLSIDSNGDIFVAALPQVYKWTEASRNPAVRPPTMVFRIRRASEKGGADLKKRKNKTYDGEYVVEKIIEDDGSLLPGSTAAVHDPETGRIFMSGAVSPFVAVCETR